MLTARTVLEASGNTGERYGRCTVIHPDLFPGTSLYGDLQLWSSDSQKLWGCWARPLYYLIISGTLNVILNLLLVIEFHLV